ncbi:MAG: Rieske 2Fe-2S domain-containing protein [Chitinophagaceae bacterium]|nr:Rieske 2Fe-2S domain-containing protein [Chitinophagaceae bacterium]
MKRRLFIKNSCAACASLIGASWILEGCGSSLPMLKTAIANNNTISVPISKFTPQNNMVIVRGAGMENDILLIKKDNAYKALYMKCTHEGIGLTATSTKLVCPAHGSLFDLEGNVLKEPAHIPLKQFAAKVENENILIYLS